ncbi:aminodeoxychorismate synthase, subunit I [Singulisphaera sp. GP187]|uniref:aminodeoxychorismate synthase component I n=1 Tax=Singulisphaera sp. GP187 TaxID=1882752 RepID=UPI000927C131|nr:aminodeoxychorismate synthase component I [Singulisphaera sp. GP187]SIO06378.1 aminodeoxychorismate synthase, subunit I [Singulisphaera sp. GP187]
MAIASQIPLHCRLSDCSAERLALLIGSWSQPALLESGPGFGEAGRWSFYTARPRLVFEVNGDCWTLRTGSDLQSGQGDVLQPLEMLLNRFDLADPATDPEAGAPPFHGGLVGFIGYDFAPRLERLPRHAAPESRMADLRFVLYDTVVTVDHATGALDLWAHDFLGEGDAARARRLEAWRSELEGPGTPPRPRPSVLGPVQGDVARGDYLEAVGRVLEYIAAGDVFQINLSQRFVARGAPEPLDLYLRLKARSPAPFAAYLQWDDLAVISASPEWFYQTRGDRLITKPIKGTRPRGKTVEEDLRLAQELAASEKDRAELTMIVDLERNDLGRVCRFGSVQVSEPLTIESFAQVHHLVATVEGQLRADAGPIDVVRALFPGGSITGAPKIRAMEIIDELEPTRRSLYTGAIGYFGRGGSSGFNIAIRTLLVEGDQVSYQVGGGIVADSSPEAEYRETLDKGRALREVLEGEGADR